jgi:hypothetical protein
MKTRHDIFKYFCNENKELPLSLLRIVFSSTSDSDLAELYGLTIIRKGYFV